MDFVTVPFLYVVSMVLRVYVWVIVGSVVLHWLTLFQIINAYHPAVQALRHFCFQATEPVLAPLRRLLPFVGGFDLSPFVLLCAIAFLQHMVMRLLFKVM
jgi:YggT family protein